MAITDQGNGFDAEAELSAENGGRGYGLSTMKERVELSGGVFSIQSAKGEGTTVTAMWPYKPQQ